MSRLSRVHYFRVRVVFDKPCSALLAIHGFRDCLDTQGYPTQYEDHHPGEWNVRGIKRIPKPKPIKRYRPDRRQLPLPI